MLLNATALYLQAKELQLLLVPKSDVCVEGMKTQTTTYDVYDPHLYSKHFLAKQTFCGFSLFSWCTRFLILCSSIYYAELEHTHTSLWQCTRIEISLSLVTGRYCFANRASVQEIFHCSDAHVKRWMTKHKKAQSSTKHDVVKACSTNNGEKQHTVLKFLKQCRCSQLTYNAQLHT